MKNPKQSFISVEKIAAELFFKIHRKTPVQESHFNKTSYVSQACNSIKEETPTEMFYGVIFEIFQDSYISGWPLLVAHKHE